MCNIILNILYHMTMGCASYVDIKMMFLSFFLGTESVTETDFLHELSPPILTNNLFCISLEKICSIKGVMVV